MFSQREFGRELFEKLGWVLSNPFVQAFVLIATAVLGGVSVFIFLISKFCFFLLWHYEMLSSVIFCNFESTEDYVFFTLCYSFFISTLFNHFFSYLKTRCKSQGLEPWYQRSVPKPILVPRPRTLVPALGPPAYSSPKA